MCMDYNNTISQLDQKNIKLELLIIINSSPSMMALVWFIGQFHLMSEMILS